MTLPRCPKWIVVGRMRRVAIKYEGCYENETLDQGSWNELRTVFVNFLVESG